MATYEDERKKQEQAAMSGTQQQNTQQPAQQPDNTQYQATMQALEGAKTQAPVYGGQYDQQIQDIYQQIVNRKKFSYDAASDPLYQQYKQQYTQQGQQAMRDTMGQAAALTGGYGSSYGQAVGQQQYDAYLQRLGEVLPETYSMALNQYNAEGDALTNQYAMLNDMATTDYNRYRDQLGDWQYDEALRRQDEETAYGRQQDAYNKLLYLINNTGYSPTDDELTAAGLTRDQADKLLYMWQLQNAGASGSSGGGSGGGGNRSSAETADGETTDAGTEYAPSTIKGATKDNTGAARSALQAVNSAKKGTTSRDAAIAYIRNLYNNGLLTDVTAQKYTGMLATSGRSGANR